MASFEELLKLGMMTLPSIIRFFFHEIEIIIERRFNWQFSSPLQQKYRTVLGLEQSELMESYAWSAQVKA